MKSMQVIIPRLFLTFVFAFVGSPAPHNRSHKPQRPPPAIIVGRFSDVIPSAARGFQMFKKPVQQARAGDRVGICVTQLDAKVVERGILVRPR